MSMLASQEGLRKNKKPKHALSFKKRMYRLGTRIRAIARACIMIVGVGLGTWGLFLAREPISKSYTSCVHVFRHLKSLYIEKTTEVMHVRSILIRGNVRAPSTEILAHLGVSLGDAMTDMDLTELASNVRKHPWVREATVRRRLPDTLFVEVSEHVPVMFVSLGGLYVADDHGSLFKRFSSADNLILPVLTGLNREEASSFVDETSARIVAAVQLLSFLMPEKVDTVTQDLANTDFSILGHVSELHWDPDLGFCMITEYSAENTSNPSVTTLVIHAGFEPYAEFPKMVQALQTLRKKHVQPQEMWFAAGGEASNIVVRLQIQKQTQTQIQKKIRHAG